jgi:hypothetical protein
MPGNGIFGRIQVRAVMSAIGPFRPREQSTIVSAIGPLAAALRQWKARLTGLIDGASPGMLVAYQITSSSNR